MYAHSTPDIRQKYSGLNITKQNPDIVSRCSRYNVKYCVIFSDPLQGNTQSVSGEYEGPYSVEFHAVNVIIFQETFEHKFRLREA